MYVVCYMASCSVLLLVAESFLRSVGLTVPLLGFFFAAAAIAVSVRTAFGFALVFGIALDFVTGTLSPWSGLLLPLLTLPAIFLRGKHRISGGDEFLIGFGVPLVMAVPHIRTTLTSPEAFASLLMSSLFGVLLFPLILSMVSRSTLRLKIGVAGEGKGGGL